MKWVEFGLSALPLVIEAGKAIFGNKDKEEREYRDDNSEQLSKQLEMLKKEKI